MTDQLHTHHLSAMATANGIFPKDNQPKILPLRMDFSLQSAFIVDLTLVEDQKRIEFVQSFYIDNSANGSPVTLQALVTGQTIIVPPLSQGYYTFMVLAENMRFSAACANPVSVWIHLANFPQANEVWYPGNNGQTTGSIGTDFSANKPALLANLLATIPVNASRNGFEVQNQAAAAIQVVMDDGAGNNISIVTLAQNGGNANGLAGADYTNFQERGRIRVYGATAGDSVMVRQW